MLESIVDILIRRDGMSREDAETLLADAKRRVSEGEDPEEILYDVFGLEPDYVLELY